MLDDKIGKAHKEVPICCPECGKLLMKVRSISGTVVLVPYCRQCRTEKIITMFSDPDGC